MTQNKVTGQTIESETNEENTENEQLVEEDLEEIQKQETRLTNLTETPTQATRTSTQEPKATVIETERTISEATNLNWSKINLSDTENYTQKNINYNNLTYKVNYYENGELVYTEIIKGNKLGAEVTVVEDRMKDEYYLDEENTTELPYIIKEGENVIDIYYLIKKYDITFLPGDNGELIGESAYTIPSGTQFKEVTVPETKANEGYCFDKWEPVLPDSNSPVTANATYTAIFATDENGNDIPDYRDTYYTVKFVAGENGSLEGTTEFSVLTGLKFGDKVTVPETKANEGYCFDKWEPVLPDSNSLVTANATYTAIFATDENGNDIPDYRDTYYTVKFVAGENGSLEGTTEFSVLTGLKFGDKVTVPEAKANEGYCFDKWEPVLPDSNSPVTANVTYTAKFTERTDLIYTVNYIYDNDIENKVTVKVENQTFKTIIKTSDLNIEEHKMHNGKKYDLAKIETKQQPFIGGLIRISLNAELNVINVYYIRPEIKTQKTSKAYTADGTEIRGTNIHVGDTIEYTIKVWNTGTADSEVTITDSAPDGTIYVSGEMSKTVNLLANTSYENAIVMKFIVKVKEGATGKITNTAEVDKGTNPKDEKEYNIIKPANIVVTKKTNKTGTVEPGDVITYTLTATNNGEEKGTTIVKDNIPEGTTLCGSIIATGITENITENNLVDGISMEVLPGGSSKIEFSVTVLDGAIGKEIKNQATYDNKKTEEVTNEVVKSLEVVANIGVEQQKNINYILLVDASNSMEGSRARNAKVAINNFLRSVWGSTSDANINIIEFASKYVIKSYTLSKGSEFSFRINMSGTENLYYTDLLAALQEGTKKINNQKANVMIILSDGAPFDIYDYNGGIMVPGANIGPASLYGGGKPYKVEHDNNVISNYVSNNIKSKGTKVYSIGFGSDANKPSTDAYKLLAKLSSDGNVLTSDDADELTDNFNEIIYSETDPVKIKVTEKTYTFNLSTRQLDSNKKIVISYDGGKDEYSFETTGTKGPLTYSETSGNYKLTFDLTNYLNKKNLQIKYYVK